jgi:L-serine dehydratase
MRAARLFAEHLEAAGLAERVEAVTCTLMGSLAATGEGHGTPAAVAAGLAGAVPETADPDFPASAWAACGAGPLRLLGRRPVAFPHAAVVFDRRTRHPRHPNALRFEAFDAAGAVVCAREYFSVGGGFVEEGNGSPPDAPPDGTSSPRSGSWAQSPRPGASPGEPSSLGSASDAVRSPSDAVPPVQPAVPFPYASAAELLEHSAREGLDMAGVARANEAALHGEAGLEVALDGIGQEMNRCIEAGMAAGGTLPGALGVSRRAAALAARLRQREASGRADRGDLRAEWLQVYAIAVGEQNAAGRRVVTAPTNGAAGIVPAVMRFARDAAPDAPPSMERDFLLVAAAIGGLYKTNASISGAEAGCQGEVGSAASMAAGALAQAWGGSPAQVENAAEIAMEHNLGLTCDPVAGLVQLPCIERNAVASGIAVAAARLALAGDGRHRISLDTVIETMRQTGRDMSARYKETSLGGLAVNVVEC